jgi:hypothetical protein
MRSAKSRLLGLLAAAVLGVLAFAASAQAVTELGSGFFIGGAQVGALKASATGKGLGTGTFSVPALKLEINCAKFLIVKGFVNSTTDGEVELLHEECTVLTNEGAKLEEAFGCEIVTNHEGGVQKHHITVTALLLPAELKDGTPAVLAEKIKALVLTKPEVGCLLPKTTTIAGEACFKVEKNHSVEFQFATSQAIQGECKARLTLEGTEVSGTTAEVEKLETEGKAFLDKLLFGVNESFIEAKADVALTGAHESKTLGVLLI